MTDIGVRKNIQRLTEGQRKQYFWCLKMLSILPPFEKNKGRYFLTIGTQGSNQEKPYNKIEPLCLYDELISSHATCCEHGSFYFGYYHRHLLFYFQVLLNYAHEVLSDTITNFQANFEAIFNLDPTGWTQFLDLYKKVAPQKKVMAHYWNPTNYNNAADLLIPDELSDPKLLKSGYVLDTLDQLFKKVRKHYPYEINAYHRWYNAQGQDNYETSQRAKLIQSFSPPPGGDQSNTSYYFYKGYTPTQDEKRLIAGDLTPRSQVEFTSFLTPYKTFASFVDKNSMPSSMKISSSRNFAKFEDKETRDNMNLLALQEGEILVNYGGRFDRSKKAYNMHYLNEEQIPDDDVSRIDMVNYNTLVPHYQLAFALFNSDFNTFVKYLESDYRNNERPHNTLHNNMHFSMNNDFYSLTNMMFFPYHSWIDIQIELKLRMCQTQGQADQLSVKMDTLTNRTEHFDPLLNPQQSPKKFGDYPIIQWSDPRFALKVATNPELTTFEKKVEQSRRLGISAQSIVVAFTAKDFYLRNTNQGALEIRSSKHLGEFYTNSYINEFNIDRLKEFKGFKNFNASYDVEIFQTAYENGNLVQRYGLLGQLNSQQPLYIPRYLQAMSAQVNAQRNQLLRFIQYFKKHKVQKPRPDRYYLKLVEKGLLIRVTYRSNAPSGNYLIYASFKQLIKQLERKKYNIVVSQKQLRVLFQEPVCVLTLSIFGKARQATKCINCGQKKTFLVNMNHELLTRTRIIWKYINLLINKQVILDSEHPENNQVNDRIDLSNIFQIKNIPGLCPLEYIRGAQEVLFDVFFQTKQEKLSSFKLSISLDVVSVQQGKPVSIATKQVQAQELEAIEKPNQDQTFLYSHRFDFYNVRDNAPLKRNELDGLLYSKVTLQVFFNGKFINASFPIKDYHELIRYKIAVAYNGVKLTYKVTDADYLFKYNYYNSRNK